MKATNKPFALNVFEGTWMAGSEIVKDFRSEEEDCFSVVIVVLVV
jgi:hypothetical protein